jgi:hypothetical protein
MAATTAQHTDDVMEPPLSEDERLLEQHAIGARVGLEEDSQEQLARLSDGWALRLTPDGDPERLTSSITRTLVEAGFVIHDCAARVRTGGVCLTPTSQQNGVIATWTTHDALRLDPRRHEDDHDVHQVMNYALFDILSALGWDVREYGHAGANLVVGRRATDSDQHQESR